MWGPCACPRPVWYLPAPVQAFRPAPTSALCLSSSCLVSAHTHPGTPVESLSPQGQSQGPHSASTPPLVPTPRPKIAPHVSSCPYKSHNPEIVHQGAAAFAHKCARRCHALARRGANGKGRVPFASHPQPGQRGAILDKESGVYQLCHAAERGKVA